METLSIEDLKATAPANPGEYALHAQVAAVLRKETRAGKPYYEVELADSGGSLKLKAWQDTAAFAKAEVLRGGEWVQAEGKWSSSEYGMEAKDWSLRPLKDEEVAAVLAGPEALREKQAADYTYIEDSCAGFSDPRFKTLCQSFLEKWGERFRRTAGARNLHHARRGGLVEHTAQMMRCANAIAGVYPQLNRDLLLTGVLFHDVGKMWENGFPADGFSMPFDFRAELMGHISIGVELVNGLWRDMEATPAAAAWKTLTPSSHEARLHLVHLVLSHHGQLEFGSPVLPKTPEALALHHVDNIDAKLEMFGDAYRDLEPLSSQVFSKHWALGGNLVKPLGELDGEPNNAASADPLAGGGLAD